MIFDPILATWSRMSSRETRSAMPLREFLIECGLLACGALSIFVTLGILGVLLFETVEFFVEVPLSAFFLDTKWTPQFANPHFGIWPLVCGTLLTASIAIGVALPFGLMAAIYLSEFAHMRTRKLVKPALELLAGVPTIVYGYFALTVVTPALQAVLPGVGGFNALSPGIVMGVMIIPMISSLSEDAIYSVPVSLREAAYGLGAGRIQTIFRVIVPAAWSGIAAAFTLAISRAIGETMIVTVAAGQQARMGLDPRDPTATMTAYIVNVVSGDAASGTIKYRTLFAVAMLLFLMTLAMNLISYRLSRRIRQGGRS
ncbi:phosphate ABC transporter permease subunit PstC [Haliangium ochraceum]|uniref:Phosphate transport system permease protein n=1 Tax=Haliangium ochraceum (strain DSM 14365 / JCM 11303 / SMP-2) TaxID=502025 RepID=D0LQ35_HALO1|nr:phosphate ABC transporter permease subunit PstC [Haliangium ochraceum]ACY17072.1 phosphate ABC transporter, inner membrane subunit PstC [Haliangium ochraceum DSM 14365]